MFKKTMFVFCLIVACFLFGLAAYLENGTTMDQQPGITLMMTIATALSFGSGILLRHRRNWPMLGTISFICAILMAIGMHQSETWPTRVTPFYFVTIGTIIVLTALYAVSEKPESPKPNLNFESQSTRLQGGSNEYGR